LTKQRLIFKDHSVQSFEQHGSVTTGAGSRVTNNGDHSDQLRPDRADLPLFRSEVFQARSSQWMGRITLPQPVSSWLVTLLAFSFAVALLTFLFIGTYTRRECVQGQLTPSPGLVSVAAHVPGTITETHVHEGERVTKNQILLEISNDVGDPNQTIGLRAPENGMVANLIAQTGDVVTAGERLLSILPQHALLKAELWLPSRAIGFVESGNRVALRYPAFPYQKFGQQSGQVEEISPNATAPSELIGRLGRMISEPLYRVVVKLDRQAVSAYGKEQPLKCGMIVDADILLEQRRLIEWVLGPLFGMSRSAQKPVLAKPEENSRR
jgi:multidrug efflux pump subunit AcrA (membrane-fusion protein)